MESQLPVSSYFEEKLFELERNTIFKNGHGYVGHELAIPNVGDYFVLPHAFDALVLIRIEGKVLLLSNVCRHRQASILKGSGNTKIITCPFHHWSYDLDGVLRKAPHFDTLPITKLEAEKLIEWQGLLFSGKKDVRADLQTVAAKKFFDFKDFVFGGVHVHEVNYNWKTFMEIYLENYHVAPFHQGLSQIVNCNELGWQFGDHFSTQTVGIRERFHQSGSLAYRKWQDALLRNFGDRMPQYGAIWLAYYPNLMIECYPNVLCVSALHPMSATKTMNIIEFYYPKEVACSNKHFIEAQQAAYFETCKEDDELALRMESGRKYLYYNGLNQVGPYQSPMEDGMRHFHEWYRRELGSLNC